MTEKEIIKVMKKNEKRIKRLRAQIREIEADIYATETAIKFWNYELIKVMNVPQKH